MNRLLLFAVGLALLGSQAQAGEEGILPRPGQFHQCRCARGVDTYRSELDTQDVHAAREQAATKPLILAALMDRPLLAMPDGDPVPVHFLQEGNDDAARRANMLAQLANCGSTVDTDEIHNGIAHAAEAFCR